MTTHEAVRTEIMIDTVIVSALPELQPLLGHQVELIAIDLEDGKPLLEESPAATVSSNIILTTIIYTLVVPEGGIVSLPIPHWMPVGTRVRVTIEPISQLD
jgi:hypothetical protein